MSSLKIILSYIVVYTTIELCNFQMVKNKVKPMSLLENYSRMWLCNLQMIEN